MGALLKIYTGATAVGVLLAVALLYWLELESNGAVGLLVVLCVLLTNAVGGLLRSLFAGRRRPEPRQGEGEDEGERKGDGE